MRMIFTGARLLLMLFTSQGVMAYELGTMCKAVDGWQVKEGTCDSQGRLQGKGTTFFAKPVLFTGNYVDGLPDGQQDMVLQENKGRHCILNFSKGEVSNSELVCTTKDDSSEQVVSLLRVAPGAGKVTWKRTLLYGRYAAQLRIDLPQLDVSGSVSIGAAGLGLGANSARFNGAAEFFLLEIDDQHTNFSLGISIQNMTTSVKSPNFEISGTFNFDCDRRNQCNLNRIFTSEPVEGKIDPRSLATLTFKNSERYELVPLHNARDNFRRVIYFKGPDGAVFDASATKNCGADLGADIARSGQIYGRKFKYTFDFHPVCGKVTTPNGQSFEGNFDRYGKPIVN